ncbi:MAG: bifunctional riboflavin kinase/FAD synthetase [Porticoccaceae bacterium]|nr:bifunctional riboflavin kinase/FAD synthetase [Pseudomonadales bacterium]MCP5172515.1 bifunctional riboflavin kinase/FAD synthetase [Pseudomonadales bacterium]
MNQNSKQFIRGLVNFPVSSQGSVVTIGSFDGVHRGHRAILEQVKACAEAAGLPSIAMIFEPQPQEYFSGEQAPARLMRMREKVEALFEQGVDQICCLQFNRSLRSLSAEAFINRVLVEGLAVRHLVVGDDFRFGCDRSGDYSMLQAAGERYGFSVQDTPTVEYQGQRISSTWVRKALDDADFELVEQLLGKHYQITGRVVYGQQLGTKLGIPTANVRLNRYRVPLNGVYAVETLVDGKWYQGAANVGIRPTVGDLIKPVLEVHLFGLNRVLYRKQIVVRFRSRIRDEKKFASLDDMVAAIKQDFEVAKQYFGQKTD